MKQFTYFPPHINVYNKDSNGREINIYKFHNCVATGINTYYPNIILHTDTGLIKPIYERTMSLENAFTNTVSIEMPTINNLYEDPVFFFVYNTDNYFHFLYDTLPYLISYMKLIKLVPNIKLLMQYPNEQKQKLYPFVQEFLDILKVEYIILNPDTLYKTVCISNSYTHDIDSNLPPRQEIYDFYQGIANSITTSIKTPPKFYVSRRTWIHNDKSNIGTDYTTRRVLMNETELVNALAQDGYEEVFTEKLSTVEKIIYFANATHVAGAIGGGISNVLFSPMTTKLTVYVSPTFLDVNRRFKYSLDCVDVYYNTSSKHVETSEFKTNMRVKTTSGIVGEIVKVENNKIQIAHTEVPVAGWNSQNDYCIITVDITDVIKIDSGLNSPWIVYAF